MDFKFLAESIKNIILNPGSAWDTIHSENRTNKFLKSNLFFPLILLVSVSALLGSLFFINTGLSGLYSVMAGIKYFLLFYLVVFFTALILAEISRALELGRDFNLTFKLVAYSAVPFLICQIISRLFESFIFINILAFYGFYIFWTGAEKILNPPEHKKIPLLIAFAITFFVVLFTADWILTRVVDKLYFAIFT